MTTKPTISEKKQKPGPAPTETAAPTAAKVRDKRPAKPKRKVSPPTGQTKLSMVVTMLRAKTGATVDQIAEATGWQRHTVRGAIAGAIKRKLGLKVMTEDRDGVRTYRITGR